MRGALLLAAVLAAGCTGYVGELGPEKTPGAAAPTCTAGARDVAGPRLLRRLTGAELDTGIRAALGLSENAWSGGTLPPDPSAANGFTNNAGRVLVNSTVAERLMETAKAVGGLMSIEPNLSRVLPCARTGDEACAKTYLDTVGRRLYRRPLTAAEQQRYLELYPRIVYRTDFAQWVRWATVALIQSPHSIYRSELGNPKGEVHQLTPYEIAASLAYTYTGAPPEDWLLDVAADPSALQTADQRLEVARKLALDANGALAPRAKNVLLQFEREWMNLSKIEVLTKSAEKYPAWNDGVRVAMQTEAESFFLHAVVNEKATVPQLLTAPYTLIDATLARYYGYGPTTAGAPQRVERPPQYGVGLLAQGAILVTRADTENTSPTLRGHFVQTHLLCVDPPPPPPNIAPLPPPSASKTTRERYEVAHAGRAECSGCHKLMDPIGFAMEHLDADGRYRERENGLELDDTGVINLNGKDETFKGQAELAQLLAKQTRTSQCVGSYIASFAFGVDHHDSECLVSTGTDALAAGGSILDYFIGMAGAPHFAQRASP